MDQTPTKHHSHGENNHNKKYIYIYIERERERGLLQPPTTQPRTKSSKPTITTTIVTQEQNHYDPVTTMAPPRSPRLITDADLHASTTDTGSMPI